MSFILSDGWKNFAIIKFAIKKYPDVCCPPCINMRHVRIGCNMVKICDMLTKCCYFLNWNEIKHGCHSLVLDETFLPQDGCRDICGEVLIKCCCFLHTSHLRKLKLNLINLKYLTKSEALVAILDIPSE
jgi:hypothetical protein